MDVIQLTPGLEAPGTSLSSLGSDALAAICERLSPADVCSLRLTSKPLAAAVTASDSLWRHQLALAYPNYHPPGSSGSWYHRFMLAHETCCSLRSASPISAIWSLGPSAPGAAPDFAAAAQLVLPPRHEQPEAQQWRQRPAVVAAARGSRVSWHTVGNAMWETSHPHLGHTGAALALLLLANSAVQHNTSKSCLSLACLICA